MHAQEIPTCGTHFDEATLANAMGARRIGLTTPTTLTPIISDFSTTERYVFNVFFHKFVSDDGTTPNTYNQYRQLNPAVIDDGIGDGDLITEEVILEAIRALNIKYNPFNIFFKYRGYDIIKNSSLLNPTNFQVVRDWVRANNNPDTGAPYYQDNAFNLYIVQNAPETLADGALGMLLGTESIYSYAVFQPFGSYWDVYPVEPGAPYDHLCGFVPHEIGHNFFLLHTSEGYARWWRYVNQKVNQLYDEATFYYSERVTRDVTNTTAPYNATYAGDHVTDTNAATERFMFYVPPPPGETQGYWDWAADLSNCSCNNSVLANHNVRDASSWDFDGTYWTMTGELYSNIQYFNIMFPKFIKDKYDTSHCNQSRTFTNGQATRMRNTIANNMALFAPLMTDVASLYEPYKVVSNTNTASSRTISLPSNINFSSFRPVQIAYYQPGFDYEVYRCSDANPHYGPVLNSYDKYSPIPHFNYAGKSIKILQLSDTVYGPCAFGLTGFVKQGSIYTQNQGTYTAQPLDSLQINNPELLINLPVGTHTINVTTGTGETLQKTIQKTP